ncbi:hypothetical protein Pcac1_g8698 [Phytophthora cactorum]|nr:hypothetical protein Pcac1_g8698 [Phytophthora cactorum]
MDHASISKHDIARFMLSEDESTQAKELLEMLFDFQEVTKALQDPTLTLAVNASLCLLVKTVQRMAAHYNREENARL